MVSGYYGFGNLGDEAILAALCKDLVALDFGLKDILVLSHDPEQTAAQHGVAAVPRYDLKAIWHALGTAEVFISGGGSLLQDVTSRRSIPYYLGLVELALLRKVPVVMYGQGLGPIRNRFFRSWVGRTFKKSSAASVRDAGSLEFLLGCGVRQEQVELCADPVFQEEMVVSPCPDRSKILLNLRPYYRWEQQQSLWLEHLASWQREGFVVEFIPLGPGDWEMGCLLQEAYPAVKVHPRLTLDSYAQVFTGAGLCISMRLHGLIFSALHDCLPVGLNYDPKVRALCTQLKIPCWEIGNIADLAAGIEPLVHRAEQHRLDYRRSLEELRSGAMQNRTVLAKVLR